MWISFQNETNFALCILSVSFHSAPQASEITLNKALTVMKDSWRREWCIGTLFPIQMLGTNIDMKSQHEGSDFQILLIKTGSQPVHSRSDRRQNDPRRRGSGDGIPYKQSLLLIPQRVPVSPKQQS